MQNHNFLSNKYCLPGIISNVKLVFEDRNSNLSVNSSVRGFLFAVLFLPSLTFWAVILNLIWWKFPLSELVLVQKLWQYYFSTDSLIIWLNT